MKKAVVLGTFDGVHLGHKAVIEKAKGCFITAVTFKKAPRAYFDQSIKALLTNDERIERLSTLGVNDTVMLDFDKVKDIPYTDFLEFIRETYKPSLICCGYNYHFGKNAEGNTERLAEYCNSHNIELSVAECTSINSTAVSSTFIREKIRLGEVETANIMLGYNFGFKGEVINGDKRGRTLGFPTVNQAFPDCLTPPAFGVYETRVALNGKTYRAITNIGIRPTFLTDKVYCETYIENFSGNIYGDTVDLRFIKFIRAERKFASPEELKDAIAQDVRIVFK